MSIGNSVIKSLESDRTKLNTKIAKLYAKRQNVIMDINIKIYSLERQIEEINKNLVEFNKQNN